MEWLILSIVSSTAIMLIFKAFKRFEISTFHAIVVNYFTAFIIGLLFTKNWNVVANTIGDWYYLALLLGALFIGLFFLIGQTTQRMGISVATVAMKLGYILPIILAFVIYKETAAPIRIFAIFLTLIAVVLSSIKKDKEAHEQGKWLIILPIIIFIGSGICDAIVQFVEKRFFPNEGFEAFTVILFLTAASLGLIASIFQDIKNKKTQFTLKNIIAGILLGIPNYFSIFFLFKALSFYSGNSAWVFPINNVGIVVSSTILAILLFRERLSFINAIGFILAVISILLMSIEYLF